MKIVYVADDGHNFESEEECKKHESKLELLQTLERIVPSRNLSWEDVVSNFNKIARVIRPDNEQEYSELKAGVLVLIPLISRLPANEKWQLFDAYDKARKEASESFNKKENKK